MSTSTGSYAKAPTAAELAEELQIRRVRAQWAFSRDQGDWEGFANCFHPDAQVSISWFTGPVSRFIELIKASDAVRQPEEHSKHWIGNSQARIHGERAVLETDIQILMREYIEGRLYDYVSWCRFVDRVEKRHGEWRIVEWSAIFDKDRLDPVLPGDAPPWLASTPITGRESGFAFMRLRQERKGRTVPAGTVIGGTPAEAELRSAAFEWLDAAPPSKD